MPRRSSLAVFFVSALFVPCLLVAQSAGGHGSHAKGSPETPPAQPASAQKGTPKEFVTRHNLESGGKTLHYRAVAGETLLEDDKGAPKASVFTISYLLEGVDDPARRPITFFFNGGPGSTAVWLHLGAFGPARLDLGADPLSVGAPPYALRPNPHSLLDVSDLVFVDPIGTGYSRALGEGKANDYWGVDEDAASMADFIRTYLTHHRRWSSPKYLAGESYGTIRASLLVRELSLDLLDSVAFNGVILIASALDVRIFLSGAPGNDLAYVTGLPTDLTTTFFGVEHTFDHSGIARDRITLKNYFGGHMMYLHEPSLETLSADIRAFIRGDKGAL